MHRWKNTALCLGMLALVSLPGPVNAEREHVLSLLEGRHWKLNAEVFRGLGKKTSRRLREIAEDESLINYLRFRAIEALSLFPTDETGDFLERTATAGKPSFARRGLRALTRGFADVQPERVRRAASRALENQNTYLRIEAARILRKMDFPLYRSFLKNEPRAWVREAARK